jgi:predicted GNAT family N-acyltransferase
VSQQIRSPQNDAEYAQYFELRWQVLRAPWGQPPGSERDEFDAADRDAEHALLLADSGAAVAAGRLHFNSTDEAQIRYMAVSESARGQGLGRRIVDYLEAKARDRGAKRVVLNARDAVAAFYKRLGYRIVGEGPLMFGSIRHVQMEKVL